MCIWFMLFITFEGVDGSGKTTQINILSDALKRLHIPHIVTREPGGCKESEYLRSMFINKDLHFSKEAETLLVTAARAEHVSQVLLPALKENKIVICDRYVDSTFIYQGHIKDSDISIIRRLHAEFCANLYPDATFIINADTESVIKRIHGRKNANKLDEKNIEFIEKIRSGYTLLSHTSQRFTMIDGNRDIDDIHSDIISHLNTKFPDIFNKR